MVYSAPRKKIFIIIDGLDVLSRKDQEILMRLFGRAFQRNPGAEKETALKVFFTSRPCPIVREKQSLYDTQYQGRFQAMDAEEFQTYIDRDLEFFITQKLKHFRVMQHHTTQVLDMIEQELKKSTSKTFLQVSFYFKQLDEEDSAMLPASVLLDRVSENLAGFYRNPFQALLDQQSPLPASTSMLLTLVAYSFKSLSIAGLAIASLCAGDDWNDHLEARPFTKDEEQSAETSLRAVIRSLASPVLKISHKGIVKFFHPSIRDSILRPGLQHFLVVNATEAHQLLALSCVRIIVRNRDPAFQFQALKLSVQKSHQAFLERPLLRCAMQSWQKHLLEAIPSDTLTTEISAVILKTFNSLMNLWTQPSMEEYRTFMLSHIGKTQGSSGKRKHRLSLIEILSDLGLDPFLRMYLEARTVSNALDSMQVAAENALLLAARGDHKGHEACFWTLLRAFNITSLEDDKFKTMISDSTKTQQPEILAEVLKLRTATTDQFVVALLAAFVSGDKDILDQLTKDRSIFTTVTNGFGMTPLHAIFAQTVKEDNFHHHSQSQDHYKSARRVRHAVAAYLLANSVEVDAVDNFGFTALHGACSNPAFVRSIQSGSLSREVPTPGLRAPSASQHCI